MALGAYSIIRYTNSLNDQRVNLGVLLWHPLDGVRHRLSPFLDRAQAVDPRVTATAVKQQVSAIVTNFEAEGAAAGQDGLRRLSSAFRTGVEVSAPYPAEMFDIDAMLERLYSELVSPVEEIRRSSTQKQYERSLKAGLTAALKHIAPTISVHDQGPKRINGIAVNLGLRMTGPQLKASSWRAVSLQAEDRADDQIAKAKAAALDIVTIRKDLPELKNDRQYVAIQPPKPKASERLRESIAWLEHQADGVFIVPSGEPMVSALEGALISAVFPRPKSISKR